jgi:hypothetical protein
MSPQRLHKVVCLTLASLVAGYLIALMIVLPQADVHSPVYFGLVMLGIGAFSSCGGLLLSQIMLRIGARINHGEPATKPSSELGAGSGT